MRNFLRKASEYYSTYSIELAFFKHRVLQVTHKKCVIYTIYGIGYLYDSLYLCIDKKYNYKREREMKEKSSRNSNLYWLTEVACWGSGRMCP
jgi:hypothetical protein